METNNKLFFFQFPGFYFVGYALIAANSLEEAKTLFEEHVNNYKQMIEDMGGKKSDMCSVVWSIEEVNIEQSRVCLFNDGDY